MSITIGIVAHEKRLVMATELARKIDADAVWVDAGFYGEWKNHMRAWKHATKTDATHAVVLQDDAVPVEGFREHVQQAILQRPEAPISLYVGTHRPWKEQVQAAVEKADKEDASWLSTHSLLWGVGLVLPVAMIPEMIEGTKNVGVPYDQRISVWTQKAGIPVYYTWPSLVDHADTETVAHPNMSQGGARVAHRTGVPDWNDRVVQIANPWDDGKVLGSSRDSKTNPSNSA